MAKRKDKLAEILQTYSEEEIRRICAESSSRTDFAKRLGIGSHRWTSIIPMINNLIEQCDLDASHFHTRQKMPTREEAELACKNAHSLHHFGQLLGLSWSTQHSEQNMLNRIVNRFELDISHFTDMSLAYHRKLNYCKHIFANLDKQQVIEAYHSANSLKEFAVLSGISTDSTSSKRSADSYLSSLGRKLAVYFDLDPEILKKRSHEARFKQNFISWLYHTSEIQCSQCKKPINDIAFLSKDITYERPEYKKYVLCPICHAAIKNECNDDLTTSLTVMTTDNMFLHGIYLIHQKSTNKIYIGETRLSFATRMREHIDKDEIQIDRELTADTIEDFEFYILENMHTTDKSTLRTREKYWIDFFGSDNPVIGYNVFKIHDAETTYMSDEEVRQVIHEIQNANTTMQAIAIKHNVDRGTITNIKYGKRRRLKDIEYPILSYAEKKRIGVVLSVLSEIENSEDSLTTIARKNKITYTTIDQYNHGIFPKYIDKFIPSKYKFPIRKPYIPMIEKMDVQQAFLELLNSDFVNAAANYGITDNALRKIFKKQELPTTYNEIREWLDDHPNIESIHRVPTRKELIETINTSSLNQARSQYGVGTGTFRAWLQYRNIHLINKQRIWIRCEELDYETPSLHEMVNYLSEQHIIYEDPRIAERVLSHAFARHDGYCYALHFSRIEKPLVE